MNETITVRYTFDLTLTPRELGLFLMMDVRADLVEAVVARPGLAAAVAVTHPEEVTPNGHAPEEVDLAPEEDPAPDPVPPPPPPAKAAAPAKPAPKAAAPPKSTASPKSAAIEIPGEPEMRAILSKTSTYVPGGSGDVVKIVERISGGKKRLLECPPELWPALKAACEEAITVAGG